MFGKDAKKLDFKTIVSIFRVYQKEGLLEVIDITNEYINTCNDDIYEVSEYVLDGLFDKDGILTPVCKEMFVVSKLNPWGFTNTREIFCNTPLWTETYKILWFEFKDIYIGYEVSPRIGSSIMHEITKYPIRIQKEKPKNEELPQGHVCIYCGTELPKDPDHYEFGFGDKYEPSVPVFICPKCGQKNYGFRLGEFVKDFYDPLG